MNGYSEELCTAIYEFNNERRVSFVENGSTIKDAITHRKFNLCDFTSFNYVPPSKSAFKYFKFQFLQHRDETVFTATEVIETNLGMLSLPLLRFFNITYSELNCVTNSKETILKISNKCKKYLKRYVPASVLDIYYKQITMFSSVVEIFSFVPEEIKENKIPFWYFVAQELFADKFIYALSGGITIDVTDKCNKCNVNLVHLFADKETCSKIINNMKMSIVDEYKQKILDAALTKIQEAKHTLEEEVQYATDNNDSDLLAEITIIKEQILDLENSIEHTINSMPYDCDVTKLWPNLLYPAPTLNFQKDASRFFDVVAIQEYFHLL
jgi:hypothetical protein